MIGCYLQDLDSWGGCDGIIALMRAARRAAPISRSLLKRSTIPLPLPSRKGSRDEDWDRQVGGAIFEGDFDREADLDVVPGAADDVAEEGDLAVGAVEGDERDHIGRFVFEGGGGDVMDD